jgi:hypothetical protein
MTKNLSLGFSVTPSTLTTILDAAIAKNRPLLIVSSPGCGKTDIVLQAGIRNTIRVVVFHPVVDEPINYKGLPTTMIVDGVTKATFLPFDELEILINSKEKIIAFFDDLGQANAGVQAAVMQLVLSRRINGFKISDNIMFVAATNRKSDKAGVSGILEPVKGRFTIVELEPSEKDWTDWAIKHNQPPELIAFIRWKSSTSESVLYNFEPTLEMRNSPNPRNVAAAGEWIADGLPEHILTPLIAGRCGAGFAHEFMAFYRMHKALPDPDLLIANPDKFTLPDKSKPDQLFAICGALAAKANKQNFDNIMKIANKIPVEFSVMMVQDIIIAKNELAETSAFDNWKYINDLT